MTTRIIFSPFPASLPEKKDSRDLTRSEWYSHNFLNRKIFVSVSFEQPFRVAIGRGFPERAISFMAHNATKRRRSPLKSFSWLVALILSERWVCGQTPAKRG